MKYRIIEENGKFYPQYNFLGLFWRYYYYDEEIGMGYTISKAKSYDSLEHAEMFIRKTEGSYVKVYEVKL